MTGRKIPNLLYFPIWPDILCFFVFCFFISWFRVMSIFISLFISTIGLSAIIPFFLNWVLCGFQFIPLNYHCLRQHSATSDTVWEICNIIPSFPSYYPMCLCYHTFCSYTNSTMHYLYVSFQRQQFSNEIKI